MKEALKIKKQRVIKEKCCSSTMKCKRVIFSKAKKLCRFHDWETKITSIGLWEDLVSNKIFHSLDAGKFEKHVEKEYNRRFNGIKSCFKEDIKEKIRNEFFIL